MTSNKLKEIASLIKKKAQGTGDYAPPPTGSYQGDTGGTPGGPATPPAAPTGHAGGGYGGNPAVIKMQQALQSLAADVSSTINLNDVTSTDKDKQKEARARDAFGVFLTKNYMRNSSKIQGVEYDPNPNVTSRPDKEKSANDPTRLSVVMDTMNRVGNPDPKKGERFVDGDWGFRTNAAIRDVYVFASGLLDFVDDVNRFLPAERKVHVDSYNRGSLDNLAGMATVDNSLTPEQKKEAAPLITQHVTAIHSMYKEVKTQILQRKEFQKFIEGDQPYTTYQPKVTQEQIALLQSKFPGGIPFSGNAKITVDNLVNMDALKTWLQTAYRDGSVTPEMVINGVREQNKQLLDKDPGY